MRCWVQHGEKRTPWSSRRPATAGFCVWLCVLALLAGCSRDGRAARLAQKSGTGPAAASASAPPPQATAEPSQIELADPKVTLGESNLVRFEVQYRFTQGKPSKYYLCEISFPGTSNQGTKLMDSWELKSAGTIKDGIVLANPPVEQFSIRVLEAESPQNGYRPISNTVSGQVH